MDSKISFVAKRSGGKNPVEIPVMDLLTAAHDTVNNTFRVGDKVYDSASVEAYVEISDEEIKAIAKK
jgi:hypothetical protein